MTTASQNLSTATDNVADTMAGNVQRVELIRVATPLQLRQSFSRRCKRPWKECPGIRPSRQRADESQIK
jgi:hypothetical protein